MTTVTPTRVPGLSAAISRTLAAIAGAVARIPPWQAVSLVMAGAAAAMVVVAPAPLLLA